MSHTIGSPWARSEVFPRALFRGADPERGGAGGDFSIGVKVSIGILERAARSVDGPASERRAVDGTRDPPELRFYS